MKVDIDLVGLCLSGISRGERPITSILGYFVSSLVYISIYFLFRPIN